MVSLRKRCQVVTVVFAAIVVVSLLAVWSDLTLLQFFREISAGGAFDESRAEAIDARQAMIGTIQMASFAVCTIVFLMWFHGAYKNLGAGGLKALRYTPRWAVGGFFVPFLNFVRPFEVMLEVWKGSAHLSGEVQTESWRTIPAPLVGWWWALFLISSILGNFSGRLMFRAEELDELMAATWMTLASDLMDIPAALLALVLVRRVTEFQEMARMRARPTEAGSGA